MLTRLTRLICKNSYLVKEIFKTANSSTCFDGVLMKEGRPLSDLLCELTANEEFEWKLELRLVLIRFFGLPIACNAVSFASFCRNSSISCRCNSFARCFSFICSGSSALDRLCKKKTKFWNQSYPAEFKLLPTFAALNSNSLSSSSCFRFSNRSSSCKNCICPLTSCATSYRESA